MKPKKILRNLKRRLHPFWWANRFQERHAKSRFHRDFPEVAQKLEEFSRQTGARGCRWQAYLALYERIRSTRPARIWEGGSGATSVLFAHALGENAAEGHPGCLVSYEEHPGYHAKFLEAFPPELREWADLRRSDVAIMDLDGMRGYYYAQAVPEPCDLFFIDGPTTQKQGFNFNADLHRFILAGFVPAIAFIDGRQGTIEAMRLLHPGCMVGRIGGLSTLGFPSAFRSARVGLP